MKTSIVFVSYCLGLALIWHLTCHLFEIPKWMVPTPVEVVKRFNGLINNGALWPHIFTTVTEILLGLLLGVSAAFFSAILLFKFPLIGRLGSPPLVALNSIPIVALAPLLLLWFGNGLFTKALIAGLMVFFPMTINILHGFQSVKPFHRRLMASLYASKWQTFFYLELPSAVPAMLTGLKIAGPLSVIGAVVGEFLGASKGLGFLVLDANARLDTPQLFVALILLALMGLTLFFLVTILDKRYLPRTRRQEM